MPAPNRSIDNQLETIGLRQSEQRYCYYAIGDQKANSLVSLARSSAAPRLPQSGELPKVLRSELVRRGASALVPNDLAGSLSGLVDEIVGKGER
jgi:hypothetical protein